MAHFSGTHVQNFDLKGRVSVPASFRAALRENSATVRERAALSEGAAGVFLAIPLVLRPSEKARCLEGWTEDRFNTLSAQLDSLDPLSAEHDAMATVIYGDAYTLETDKEGRIVIPDALLRGAGISRAGSVAFLGLGTRFQLWEPSLVPGQKAAALAAYHARVARQKDAES